MPGTEGQMRHAGLALEERDALGKAAGAGRCVFSVRGTCLLGFLQGRSCLQMLCIVHQEEEVFNYLLCIVLEGMRNMCQRAKECSGHYPYFDSDGAWGQCSRQTGWLLSSGRAPVVSYSFY